MKILHLIRHAKSSWNIPALSDIQRPLNKRGKKDSSIMSVELSKVGFRWPKVYCSPALRAQLTIKSLFDHWPYEFPDSNQSKQWQTDEDLYTFNAADIWTFVGQLDEDLDAVLLVGHNPAFTDFINAATHANLKNFPTCAYARIIFSVSHWSEIDTQSAVLNKFMKPKTFKLG